LLNKNTLYSHLINRGCETNVEDGLRKGYKLKADCHLYKDVDIIIAFGANYNGYYASILAERLDKPFILSLRVSDVNLAKWFAEKIGT